MSLRLRLVISLIAILIASYLFFTDWLKGELKTQYAYVTEESLVDLVQLLAHAIEDKVESGSSLSEATSYLGNFPSRKVEAEIYGLKKMHPAVEFYVVDRIGKVLFAHNKKILGKDYSKWNDVHLALQGKYGARSTRKDPEDPLSSQYIIAAPLRKNGEIIGAVSVIKNEIDIVSITSRPMENVIKALAFVFLIASLFAGFISFWFTRPIELIKNYAVQVSHGMRVAPPKLKSFEFRNLTDSIESMRVAIDGQKKITSYTQNLTHELKSPLTAIAGAAELMTESMPEDRRLQFLGNISDEASRARDILDHLLKIASLEELGHLEEKERVDFDLLSKEILASVEPHLTARKLTLDVQGGLIVEGSPFLCAQALRNLVENAIDFAEPGSKIEILMIDRIKTISVFNVGPEIPDYAQKKLLEKFFSLERPDTGRKGSGLGLSFVREVMKLHQGSVVVENVPSKAGVQATLLFS